MEMNCHSIFVSDELTCKNFKVEHVFGRGIFSVIMTVHKAFFSNARVLSFAVLSPTIKRLASFLLLSIHLGIPTDWCLENVAKLLKLCGESVCFEVLGNKAVNGRVHELSYLVYYLGQVYGL